jgi:hypothetical protein
MRFRDARSRVGVGTFGGFRPFPAPPVPSTGVVSRYEPGRDALADLLAGEPLCRVDQVGALYVKERPGIARLGRRRA